jgi:hypothetical protein
MKFPVVLFRGNRIVGYESEKQLFYTTHLAVKNGYYDNISIIDADGVEYSAFSVEILKRPFGFLGYDLFLNMNILIDLRANTVRQLALHAFKKKIVETLMIDRIYWEAGEEIKPLIQEIENMHDFQSIIKRVTC